MDIAAPRFILDAGAREFDGLDALPFRMDNVHVLPHRPDLEAHKATVIAQVRGTYTMETLKDVPELRAYRDFFWRVGIDPTKIRPAAEALIRRILGGKPLPTINTLACGVPGIPRETLVRSMDMTRVVVGMFSAPAGKIAYG